MNNSEKLVWCGYCENKYEEHEIGNSLLLQRACNNCYRNKSIQNLTKKITHLFTFLVVFTGATLLLLYFITKR